jgi:heme exporter protein D
MGACVYVHLVVSAVLVPVVVLLHAAAVVRDAALSGLAPAQPRRAPLLAAQHTQH